MMFTFAYIGFLLVHLTISAASDGLVTENVWQVYKQKHGKSYASQDEEISRRRILQDNIEKINSHNLLHQLGLKSHSLGVNQFSDLTWDEFKRIYLTGLPKGGVPEGMSGEKKGGAIRDVPDQMDFRDYGIVTPVKDQGQCGSCWAFASAGALEGLNGRQTGTTVDFAPQNLVDCDTEEGGCDGGWPHQALQWTIEHGIALEKNYPYTGEQHSCQKVEAAFHNSEIDYRTNTTQDEMKEFITIYGPTVVAFEVTDDFSQYQSGVYYSDQCTGELNHAVLLIGYGKDGEQDFWIIKNSWTTGWGEKGYARMARNRGNMCGLGDYYVGAY